MVSKGLSSPPQQMLIPQYKVLPPSQKFGISPPSILRLAVFSKMNGRRKTCNIKVLWLRTVLNRKPFKNDKNVFYFTEKALFFLKIFKFLSWLFGHVTKWLDIKDKVNFKFHDVTVWLTNHCNTRISQYLGR